MFSGASTNSPLTNSTTTSHPSRRRDTTTTTPSRRSHRTSSHHAANVNTNTNTNTTGSSRLHSGQTTPRAATTVPIGADAGTATATGSLFRNDEYRSYGSPSLIKGRTTGSGERIMNDSNHASVTPGIGTAAGTLGDSSFVDKVLVKDEKYSIVENKIGLPSEVKTVLLNADPYVDPINAVMDYQTGFAYLVSKDYCFVWNWVKRSTLSTIYSFPLPSTSTEELPSEITLYSPLSLVDFVPSTSANREPGLLITSIKGQLRFWESISMSLSGVDRYQSLKLEMTENEFIKTVHPFSSQLFVLTTSKNRIGLISFDSFNGRIEFAFRFVEKNKGWAGSVWNAVFSSSSSSSTTSRFVDPSLGIHIVTSSAIEENGQRFVYTIAGNDVHVWSLPNRDDGSERFVIEHDWLQVVWQALIGNRLASNHNQLWINNEAKIKVVDAKVDQLGHLILFVSYIDQEKQNDGSCFAIVSLQLGSIPNSINVVSVRRLVYQTKKDPRPLSEPRLSLLNRSIALITFVDTILLFSLEPTSSFEESFALKTNTNRFLGTCIKSTIITASSSTSFSTMTLNGNGSETFALLTASASILTLRIDTPTIESQLVSISSSSESNKTKKLQTKIEQAIYFGSEDDSNPLKFELTNSIQGDLSNAVESISQQLLNSSSIHSPLIMDLRIQLNDRYSKSIKLIHHISSLGLLGRLNQSTRRKLSQDAEKLFVAIGWWNHLQSNEITLNGLLSSIIIEFMEKDHEKIVQDPLRSFFRTRISSIGIVVDKIYSFLETLLNEKNRSTETKCNDLEESNRILLIMYGSIEKFRKESNPFYRFDSTSLPIESWTSKSNLIEFLNFSVESTNTLLFERLRELGSSSSSSAGLMLNKDQDRNSSEEMKKQMVLLTGYTFEMNEERLLFLGTGIGQDKGSKEAREANEKYLKLRTRFLKMLVGINKVASAYELAERHQDFDSLVELSTDRTHGSKSRLDYFLRKYQQRFAFPLYRFYVDHSMFKILLEQDELYQPLLTSFLDQTDNDRISWINDLAIRRYAEATEALVSEAEKEIDLAQKKIMLSLGKLTRIAQVTKESLGSEEVQRSIETIDDSLDLVNSQSTLLSTFESHLPSNQHLSPISQQAKSLTQILTSHLSSVPLRSLFEHLTISLLSQRILTSEDLIELLTLSSNQDFTTALEVLIRSKDLPPKRYSIELSSIWRRCYLSTDWIGLRKDEKKNNDQELMDRLKETNLFTTLKFVRSVEELGDKMILNPRDCFFSQGEETNLERRFERNGWGDLDGFVKGLKEESEALRELIEGEVRLEEYCKEIERLLVAEEQQGEGEDDVVMV